MPTEPTAPSPHAAPAPEVGKRIAGAVYYHKTAVPEREYHWVTLAEQLAASHRGPPLSWQVCKLDLPTQAAGGGHQGRVTLLKYPDFFEEAFPRLHAAWTVDLPAGPVQHRRWPAGGNQPILHRKELLLPADHPQRAQWGTLTQQATAHGLFDDPAIIGHLWQWQEELAARGLAVQGHQLVGRQDAAVEPVLRHRTALSRNGLSTPVQALWRHGLLQEATFFDYGCGRGDDLRALSSAGLDTAGWDPHFRPDGDKRPAQAVNLGFVLNVIEDPLERRQALLGAWALAERVLSVGVLIGGRTAWERHRLLADGVLTSRGTFQKYFTTAELEAYVEGVTGRQPIAVAPGVVLVFRSDEDEQRFLRARQQQRPQPAPPRPERAPKPDKPSRVGRPEKPAAERRSQRVPLPVAVLEPAQRDDLLVYLALQLFERRRSFAALPAEVQADVRTGWGSLVKALDAAKTLLFGAGKPEAVAAACQLAADQGLGAYERGEGLYVVADRLPRLPALLRVYVGCGERLYGEASGADALKIHDRSGKLTLLHYDDFWGQPIPLLVERVKIDLPRLRIDFFEYDGQPHQPQPLYFKGHWLSEGDPLVDEQQAFDRALLQLPGIDWSGFGPPLEQLRQWLAGQSLAVADFALVATPPPV